MKSVTRRKWLEFSSKYEEEDFPALATEYLILDTQSMETRICQNCKQSFTIEAEDFAFYEKMEVPAPTFCPECRMIRRVLWRNERMLYRRTCSRCNKNVISGFAPDSIYKIFCEACYWSDTWDPLQNGMIYDFTKTFFDQFRALLQASPYPNLNNLQCTNSDYCNFCYQSKNCYLNFASDLNEDSAYLYHTVQSKNSYDLLGSKNMEQCYECVASSSLYRSLRAYYSRESMNSQFLYNCRNVDSCIGCVNVKNVKYQILNVQYDRIDYEKELRKLGLHSWSGRQAFERRFREHCLLYPRRFADHVKVENSTGDYLHETKNCRDCFDVEGPAEDSRYVVYGVPHFRDVYDGYGLGVNVEHCYEIGGTGANVNNAKMSHFFWEGHSGTYSYFCRGSANVFGCVGLRKKEYCILNTQYSKNEYEGLVQKIIGHMNSSPYIDSQGRVYRYGEFFPPDIVFYAYNETLAQEYDPLTEEEAIGRGYAWRKETTSEYGVTQTYVSLPDSIDDVTRSILQDTIACEHGKKCKDLCTGAFRLIPSELEFYKLMRLPIPRLCPNCRHFGRLKERNPFRLWKRKCGCGEVKGSKLKVQSLGVPVERIYKNTSLHFHGEGSCPNSFETTYAPERPEIVYCEECYQAEVA